MHGAPSPDICRPQVLNRVSSSLEIAISSGELTGRGCRADGKAHSNAVLLPQIRQFPATLPNSGGCASFTQLALKNQIPECAHSEAFTSNFHVFIKTSGHADGKEREPASAQKKIVGAAGRRTRMLRSEQRATAVAQVNSYRIDFWVLCSSDHPHPHADETCNLLALALQSGELRPGECE